MKLLFIAGLCLVTVATGKPSAQEAELMQLRKVLYDLERLEARHPRPPPPGASPPPGEEGRSSPPPPGEDGGSSPPPRTGSPPPPRSTTAAPSKRQGGEGGDDNVRCVKDAVQDLKDALEALKGCLPPPPTTPAPGSERTLLLRALENLLLEEMNN